MRHSSPLLTFFADILNELGDQFIEYKEKLDAGEAGLFVKFFDDEDFELVPVDELNKVESYSCKSKKKYIRFLLSCALNPFNISYDIIRAGFRKHEENKRGNLGGSNLRLAQFYKDVEMAEVMTDNDHAVAKILESYEIAETEENENEFQKVILEGQMTQRGEGSRQTVASELAKQPEVADIVKSKTSKKNAKKGSGLKKDALKEIKNGKISKNK